MAQVAADVDLTDSAVRGWTKQGDIDSGTRHDEPTTDERAELARLRAGNQCLRQGVEILKRATAFFAKKETR